MTQNSKKLKLIQRKKLSNSQTTIFLLIENLILNTYSNLYVFVCIDDKYSVNEFCLRLGMYRFFIATIYNIILIQTFYKLKSYI